MIVFHGTNVVIEQPKIFNRFKTLDFGEGFYTTENEMQARDFAIKVCQRRTPALFPVVNCFDLFDKHNVWDLARRLIVFPLAYRVS